jgi:hypothetical protein
VDSRRAPCAHTSLLPVTFFLGITGTVTIQSKTPNTVLSNKTELKIWLSLMNYFVEKLGVTATVTFPQIGENAMMREAVLSPHAMLSFL